MKDFISFSEKDYGPLGPKSAELIKQTDKYSAKNYPAYPFVANKAKGAWIYDIDGNKALDFLSSYSAILKHRHEGVVKAVIDEMISGSDLVSRAIYSKPFAEFSEAITEFTGYDRVMPKSDGGSITDTAMKGLFMHAKRKDKKLANVILTEDYFHGRSTIFATNALFDENQKAGIPFILPCIRVVKNDIQSIRDRIDDHTMGVFMETHKGEGGPLFTTKEHYMAIRNLTKERGLFLGCDEIQTGLGRCGYDMAWQEFVEPGEEFGKEKARPDFITLGKALGGGIIPVSAIVGTEEFMDVFQPGTDGSTHGGYPLACVAACAVLKYLRKEDIPRRARELGNYFVKQLKTIPEIDVEHKGALIRVEIPGVDTTKYACLEMLLGENINPRVLMKHGHKNYTRIAPPIGAMTERLIDRAVERTIGPVLSKASW